MDDHDAVIALVQQEWFAYPAEVELALFIQLDSRPDARVNKEIVAEAVAIDEAFEKLDMFPGNRRPDDLQNIIFAKPCELGGVQSVALQTFGSAKQLPFGDEGRLAVKNSK